MNHLETAVSAIEKRIDQLHDEAFSLVDNHWSWMRQVQGRQDGLKWSVLAVRCQRKEGSNSIGLTWNKMQRLKTKAGKLTVIYTHIPRPEGSYGYSLSTLRRLSRDWEWDAVETLEKALAEIRRESSFCNKALTALRQAAASRKGAG